MFSIRMNTFETNSSSTHSLVVVTDEECKKWENGELFYLSDEDKFINKREKEDYEKEQMAQDLYDRLVYGGMSDDKESLIECIKNGTLKDRLEEDYFDNTWYGERPQSYDDYMYNNDLETDINTYITKSGEKLTILCRYGYDG